MVGWSRVGCEGAGEEVAESRARAQEGPRKLIHSSTTLLSISQHQFQLLQPSLLLGTLPPFQHARTLVVYPANVLLL